MTDCIKTEMHCSRIRPLLRAFVVWSWSAVCFGAAVTGHVESRAADGCQLGAYRLPDGEIVDIRRSEGDTLRWRKFEGSTGVLHKKQNGSWTSTLGWTDRPDGHTVSFSHCAGGEIEFDGEKARRIPFDVTDTAFEGRGGVKLAGRLVLPMGKIRYRSSFWFTVRRENLRASRMRSKDCCRPRILVPSSMISAGPAALKARTRRISIYLQMTPWLRCEKPDGSLAALCQDRISGRQSGRLGRTTRRNTRAGRFRYCQFRVGCLRD